MIALAAEDLDEASNIFLASVRALFVAEPKPLRARFLMLFSMADLSPDSANFSPIFSANERIPISTFVDEISSLKRKKF